MIHEQKKAVCGFLHSLKGIKDANHQVIRFTSVRLLQSSHTLLSDTQKHTNIFYYLQLFTVRFDYYFDTQYNFGW